MIKKQLLSILLLISSLSASTLETQIGIGYRQDSLNWNIAGPGHDPNVLSELKWKNLNMVQYSGQAIWDKIVYLRLTADYAQIYSGSNTDTDWDGDDRTLETSFIKANAGRGEAYDLTGGIGWWRYCLCSLEIMPLIGYSLQEQHLHMYDGEIVRSTEDIIGPFSGLNSTYYAKWYGPWIGFDLKWNPSKRFGFYSAFEWHYVNYSGTGHWNLRSDILDDFKHNATGWGAVTKLGIDYQVRKNVSLGLLGQYQTYWTNRGWDRAHFVTSQGVEVEGSQPLNRVNWHSASIMTTLSYFW